METGTGRDTTKLEASLHNVRKNIDKNIQEVGKYKLDPNSETPDERNRCQREIALAYTKLQEAKMWVGKCLEAIGSPFPEELRDEAEQPDKNEE